MDVVWDGARNGPGGAQLLCAEELRLLPVPDRDRLYDKRVLPTCDVHGCRRRVGYPEATLCGLHEFQQLGR